MDRQMPMLSKREQEILDCLSRRLTNDEIAAELHLALSSVKWYVRQILNKLGANNRREAIQRAQEAGLLRNQPDGSPAPSRVENEFPSGMVTFLFTDIEGSTPLWEKMPEAMQLAVAQHHTLLRQAIESNGGKVFQVIGDAFQAAFRLANDGLCAALAAQRALRDAKWGPIGPLKVRIGLHTGPAELDNKQDATYKVSHTLNRAARIMSAGYGGMILLSKEAADLVERDLAGLGPLDGVTLKDLGEHRLKGMDKPENLYQVLTPDLPQKFPALATVITRPNNLPIQLTSFIGREAEIGEVTKLLNQHRLVTLTGSGGVGKTSLALSIARQQVERFPAGVWLLELASLSNPALVISTVAQAVGLSEVPGVPVIETLTSYLKNRRLLLVLDNCEHLLPACAFLADALLKNCPFLYILATSREFLNVPGEAAYRVPSLPVPDLKTLPPFAQLVQVDAVRLFVERAQAVTGFALNEANAQDVATICRRLDGIPLAIELAAARVRVLPVAQITTRLDNVFSLLMGGARTALPRQQTLKATIDWSYALLSEQERLLLQRLSVFSGGWTLEAAEVVCAGEGIKPDQILNLLTSLVDKSLVLLAFAEEESRTFGGWRYRMLEIIRQYSRERLLEADAASRASAPAVPVEPADAAGGVDAVRSRHLVYFREWCERVEPLLTGKEQVQWLDRVEKDLDNLRLALEWSLRESVEEGLRLAGSLEYFWENRSHWLEGRHWLERLLDREAENRGDQPLPADTDRTADLLLWMKSYNALISLFNAYAGSPDARRWITLIPESIQLCQQMGEVASRELAKANLHNAFVLFWRGESEKAIALLEEILPICRQKQFRFEETNATYLAGYYSLLIGELQKGQAWLETALAMARQQEWPDLIATCLGILGVTVGFYEDQARGKALLEEGLEIFKTLGNIQEYHWNAVLVLHFCQDHESILRAKTAYTFYQDTRNNNRLIWTFANLIYAEWSNGQTEQAEQWGQKAFQFITSDPQLEALNRRNYSFVFLWLARLALTRGEISQARRHIQTTLPWFGDAGRFLAFDYTHFLDALAVFFAVAGQYPLAARTFGAVAEMYGRYRTGLGARQQKEHEEAIQLVRGSLAAENFAEAWEAGRAMTIVEAVSIALAAMDEH